MDISQQYRNRIVAGFNEFNSWVPCRKGTFILSAFLSIHIVYWLFFELMVWAFPDAMMIDIPLVRGIQWLWIGFLFVSLGVAYYYARINSDSVRPFNAVAYIYNGFTLLYCYGFGFLDSVHSAFIIMMVTGVLILEVRALGGAFIMFVTWAVTALVLGIAINEGWLPYAPFVLEREFGARAGLGWYWLSFFWIVQALFALATWMWVVNLSRSHAMESLQRNNTLIRRYVPPAVAERIISGEIEAVGPPQRRIVTMLHSDVAGFTRLADQIEPEALTQLLSDYLGAMAHIVEAHHGTLCEYSGDGLLAIFGAPEDMPTHEQVAAAVNVARNMQQKMRGLNNTWQQLGIPEPIQVRIGINTGQVSVGSFGSEGRMTYTAIGLPANVTARIQFEAAPGSILISDDSLKLLPDGLNAELLGQVVVKGVHEPIKVHELQK